MMTKKAETETQPNIVLVSHTPLTKLQSIAAYSKRQAADKRLMAKRHENEAAGFRREAEELDREAAQYAAAAEALAKVYKP